MNVYRFSRLFILLALFATFGCGSESDDDASCLPATFRWNTPYFSGAGSTMFLTDENGALTAQLSVESQGQFDLATDACPGRSDLSLLYVSTATVEEGGNQREVSVFNLTTVLGATDGLVWDTLPQAAPVPWEVAVSEVNSLEALRWPAAQQEPFGGDAFIDPQADLLSFGIRVPEGAPAYATVRANGEAQERSIWVGEAREGAFSFAYNDLPSPQPFGPVDLPNGGNWRFWMYGQGPFGEALLDYSFLPDLVSGSFGLRLPATGPEGFRLLVEESNTFEGYTYAANRYNQLLDDVPASIPASGAQFSLERTADTVQVSTTAGPPDVYRLRILAEEGEGPWLHWTIYGSPQQFETLVLPQWPALLTATRNNFLGGGQQVVALLSAMTFDRPASYDAFIEAKARKTINWEAEQGLLERTRAFRFEP